MAGASHGTSIDQLMFGDVWVPRHMPSYGCFNMEAIWRSSAFKAIHCDCDRALGWQRMVIVDLNTSWTRTTACCLSVGHGIHQHHHDNLHDRLEGWRLSKRPILQICRVYSRGYPLLLFVLSYRKDQHKRSPVLPNPFVHKAPVHTAYINDFYVFSSSILVQRLG